MAQPQPAGLARGPVRDRPRCRALLPPRLARWDPFADRFAAQPYDDSEHILRHYAAEAGAQDEELTSRITRSALEDVLAEVPDGWLEPVPGAESPDALRELYVSHLLARVSGPRAWLPGTGEVA